MCLAGVLVGSGYLHALNLVSLVGVSLVRILVGSGYLHTLNLVSLVGVSLLVRVPWLVCLGWKWLPAYLEPCVLGWCWFVCLGSCGSCWLVWLPAYLEPRVLGSCALLVSWLEVITYMP